MIVDRNIPELPSYGSAACYCNYPEAAQIAAGVVPLDSLPAEWWNAMWACNNGTFNCARTVLGAAVDEICNAIICSGIVLNAGCNNQLYQAIKQYGTADQAGAVKSSSIAGQVSIDTNGIMSLNCYGSAALQTTAQNLTGAINELKSSIDNFATDCIGACCSYVCATACHITMRSSGTNCICVTGDNGHNIFGAYGCGSYNDLEANGCCSYNYISAGGYHSYNSIYVEGCNSCNSLWAHGCCSSNRIYATGLCGYNSIYACDTNGYNCIWVVGDNGYNCLSATGSEGNNQLYASGAHGYNELYTCGSEGYNCLSASGCRGHNKLYASGDCSYNELCAVGNCQVYTCISTIKPDPINLGADESYVTTICTGSAASTYTLIQQERNSSYNQMLLAAFDLCNTTAITGIEIAAEAHYMSCNRSPFIKLRTGGNVGSGESSLKLCTCSPYGTATTSTTYNYGCLQYDGNLATFNVGRKYNTSITQLSNVFQVNLDVCADCYSASGASYSTPPSACFYNGTLCASAFHLGCVSCCWRCTGGSAPNYIWQLMISRNTNPSIGCGANSNCLYIFTELGMWQLPPYTWTSTSLCCTAGSAPSSEGVLKGLIVYG